MGLPEFGQVASDNERAAPTRIGARPERYGLSVHAEYCLGGPAPLAKGAERMVANLADEAAVAKCPLARDAVDGTLRSHPHCRIVD